MNKTELIASVAQKTELTKKDAEKAVKAVFDTVAEELAAGGKVQKIIHIGCERDLSRSLFFIYLWYNAQRKGAL